MIIYDPPEEIGDTPDVMSCDSWDEIEEKEKEWTEKLEKWCKKNSKSKSKYIGKVIREPVADGYAQYMILSLRPLAIVYMPLGDGYEFRWANRWTVSDVKMLADRLEDIKNLFGRD